MTLMVGSASLQKGEVVANGTAALLAAAMMAVEAETEEKDEISLV